MRALPCGLKGQTGARRWRQGCRLRTAGGKVHTVIIQNVGSTTLFPIIRARIKPDAVVYSDSFQVYDVLSGRGPEFRHMRINHRELFAERGNHINGIARTSGARPNATCAATMASPKAQFPPLYLKECEWRFNYRPANRLLATLKPGSTKLDQIPIQ